MLDLVGALQGAVDLATQLRTGIGRIERLVGIHRAGGVGVGGDLPARQVDRLQPGADHLHRLIAGQRAERVDVRLGLEQLPQLQRATVGEGVLDRHRAAQPGDILGGIATLDTIETALGSGDEIGELGQD